MGVNCKISCEVDLSKNNKRRNYKEEKAVDMKSFTCEICSKLFSGKSNLKRHISEVHHGKHRDVECGKQKDCKMEVNDNFISFETVQDENKYIDSVLNSVKTDFERKRELGKKQWKLLINTI